MWTAVGRRRSDGLSQLVDVLAHVGRAEGEHRLEGVGLLEQLAGPLGEQRIDEQEAQLGLVASVEVVVEGPERVQRGEAAAGQDRCGLAEVDLGPVGRQHADALARLQAALAEQLCPPPEQVGHGRVGELAVVLPEGDAVREAAQGAEHQVAECGAIVQTSHGSAPQVRAPLLADRGQSVGQPVRAGDRPVTAR